MVKEGCANARLAARLCDMLEGVLQGRPELMTPPSSSWAGVELHEVIEDPDDRPYIWDLED